MKNNLPFTNPLSEIKTAIDAVLKAGDAVLEIYNQDFSVSKKENNEPITEADIKSNNIIKKTLLSLGYPILSEESPDDLETRLGQKKVWIVDPLDGTTDFINKTGEFTIMIALVEKYKPILGVIFNPSKKELYIAQKGGGAFRSSKDKDWIKIQVSTKTQLDLCKVVGSRFHQSEGEKKFLDYLHIQNFTSRGSSLKVADISSGIAEIYFTITDKIKQWDTCASYCLATEAGGIMTDIFGNDLTYNTESINHKNGILVTNGLIHQQIIEKYNQFVKK